MATKAGKEKDGPVDRRPAWLKTMIRQSFSGLKTAKFNKAFDSSKAAIVDWLDNTEQRALFLVGDSLNCYKSVPEFVEAFVPGTRGVFFLKRDSEPITNDTFKAQILFGELDPSGPLRQLEGMLSDLLVPLVSNSKNARSWGGDLAQVEMSSLMRSLLSKVTISFGESRGETRLPLPATTMPAAGKQSATSSDTSAGNERVHLFEGAIVTWTRQIKKVLELDAEEAMKARGALALPAEEILFWENKARKLNAIFAQLQRDRVRKILRFLDLSKSTYCAPFARLCKEVFAARVESNDNAKFLHTLDPWFRKLETTKWADLPQLFVPILHIILLIWKNSRCYNTTPRLVVLMWQICNALIRKARTFVSGEKIFALIADEEAGEAVEKLKQATAVCSTFKTTYFNYKATADAECPSNAWHIPNEAIFGRLDSFIERLHDVLELTQTVIQLGRLEKIEIGGSKGSELTVTLGDLYSDFQSALTAIEEVPYDICDIDAESFPTDHTSFKASVQNIEVRLGVLLLDAFDSSPSLYAKFRLVQSFDDMMNRGSIADAFEKRHVQLLEQTLEDLGNAKRLFISHRDYPPIPSNLPPISGAITWSSGILRRIKDPVRRLQSLQGIISEREEFHEVMRFERAIVASIEEYIMQKIEEWGRDVETTSHAKLKLPLLKRSRDDGTLTVNFDRDLVRLLREVKYFLVLDLPVPESALQIYEHAEHYRTLRLGLEYVSTTYNKISGMLLPVEKPLVQSHVAKFDSSAQKGIKELNWKTDGVDEYVKKLTNEVMSADKVVNVLKSNLGEAENIMTQWVQPLLERTPGATVELAEIVKTNQPILKQHYAHIKDTGKAIHRLMKDSAKAVKISQNSPDWKAYLDLVNDVVVDGLAEAAGCSLDYVLNLLELKPLGKTNAAGEVEEKEETDAPRLRKKEQKKPQEKPLIMVRLMLQADKIVFLPSLGETPKRSGITDLVNNWVRSFVGISALVKRLDTNSGTYVKELQNNLRIRALIARIDEELHNSQQACVEFYQEYEKYSHLFKVDIDGYFSEFLQRSEIKEEEEKVSALIKKKKVDKRPEYDMKQFDKEIIKYTALIEEIQSLPVLVNLGWLLADPLPIKQALLSYAMRWKQKFTMFLLNDVTGRLQDTYDFIRMAKDGLTEVTDGDSMDQQKLLGVMGHIRDIRKRMDSTASMVPPLKLTCGLLKKHGVDLAGVMVGPPADDDENKDGEDSTVLNDAASDISDDSDDARKNVNLSGPMEVLDYLDAMPVQWQKLVDLSIEKKAVILPLRQREVGNIKEQVDAFFLDVRAFRNDFRKNAPFKFTGKAVDAFAIMDTYMDRVREISTRVGRFNDLQELFELPVKSYPEIDDTQSDLFILKKVWDYHDLIGSTYRQWKSTLYHDIDVDTLLKKNKALSKAIRKFGQEDQIAKQWQSYRDVEQMTKDMDTVLPIVQELHNPAMKQRHWRKAAECCEVEEIEYQRPDFSLGHLWDLDLPTHGDDVLEVVETATKEAKIEKKLKTIAEVWAGLCLEYTPYKETEIMLIKVGEEVIEALEAHQMELQSMVGMGKFVEFFKDQVLDWQMKLGNVEDTLKVWNSVIKSWASLESIFLGSADIRAQLPEDTKRFEAIDEMFKDLQGACVSEPNVVKACAVDKRTETLREMQKDLALCQKALNEYLDAKKKVYPRFYFVSTRALLDILSNGNNPPRIMRNLTDCYSGIKTIEFKEESSEGGEVKTSKNVGTGMVAIDGEKVIFNDEFNIKGAVENWLNNFTEHMKMEVRTILEHAIGTAADWYDADNGIPRHEWLFNYPAQVAITTTQIYWTEETEDALDEYEGGTEDAVKKYLAKCTENMNALIRLVLGKLSKGDRKKIISLITMDVHARDMVQRLITEKAESTLSFIWQMQMRLYWSGSDEQVTTARIVDYQTRLSYEYIGNTGRLVITPLTDRCYITLCTALKLMLSGAPAGPAGTGKTETVKDLSRCFQIAIYVFNGSPQMTYQTICDIFKGLSQSGTWGCFDEFNRISIEVLSIVATQVQTVQEGIRLFANPENREDKYKSAPPGQPPQKVGSINLMGDVIGLIPTIGIYITMNPGYAGRTELPENLKTLFRSCAMIRPDLAIICEIMLMAEGFFAARRLAVKFITLYTLSGALLSRQPHYDWGLRAVRSVLVVAGVLKRAAPEEPEEQVLMRALRDFNTPKIPSWDIPIFMRLMADLFPTYFDKTPIKVDDNLKQKATDCAVAAGLMPDKQLVAKVIQFQELLDVRHSVMLLGPGGCGKSTIWKILRDCHNVGHTKRVAIAELINPKAIDVDELFGYMTLSKDWKDGALSIIMRGMSKNDRDLGYGEHQTTKWIVCDGDIDTLWIESMNTVMDDNKMLTLVSNERIPLNPEMRMVFEIDSLKNASPATVTRAGILYINEEDIGWKPAMLVWANSRSKAEKQTFPELFERYIPIIKDVARHLIPITPVFILSKIQMMLSIIADVMNLLTEESQKTETVMEHVFVYAMIWAFGGVFIDDKTQSNRAMFNEIFLENFPDFVQIEDEDETIFDYRYVPTTNSWELWADLVHEHEFDPDEQFSSIYVTTPANQRFQWIIDSHSRQGTPLMLVGLAGSGKTQCALAALRGMDRNKMLSCEITANYYMEHRDIQREIEAAIDKRSGRIFGPPPGKKMVYFVDDFNLPFIETYGTQSAHSLLRMAMDFENFFDRDDLSLRKEIEDCQYLTAMNPTSGSFNVARRVQRHFSCTAVPVPDVAESVSIFAQILNGNCESFDDEVKKLLPSISSALGDLHQHMCDKFLPSAVKFMYYWNLREYSNVTGGLCRASPQDFAAPASFLRLFVHESYRVYRDRLVNLSEESRFNETFVQIFTKHFTHEDLDVAVDVPAVLDESQMIFTAFAPRPGSTAGNYQEVLDMETLSSTMEAKLEDYNDRFTIMELVLFRQALEHVARIARVLSVPAGNTMLVGVGGSGKQSLSRLAGFICGMEIIQLQISSRFTEEDLQEALRAMFKTAGVKGQPILFLMTDSQVVNDKFLVYINNILTKGWIPGLFPREEIDAILGNINSAAKQAGIADNAEDRLSFFISRVRSNLHLSLCFSPVGDVFRIRARRFPGLISATVIDQFHPWPREALVSVAGRFLAELDVDDESVIPKLAEHMAHAHLSVDESSVAFKAEKRRFNYVTPKSYLELIAFYKMLLGSKTKDIMTLIDRLDIGLSTLKKTSEDVAELRVDLEHTMEKVREKTEATEALLKHMAVEKEKADIALQGAQVEAEKAGKASKEAEKIQVEADRELVKAKPAMDAANEAVDCLDKNSLNELKGFPKPPTGVPDVTAAVLMMLEGEYKNHSWDRAKKMMANLGLFLEKLQNFNAEELPEKLVKRLAEVVQNPMMDKETMMAKSSAAANLASWVVNVYRYNRIYVKVKPLMDALEEANAAKAAAEDSLAAANATVAAANEVLAGLRQKLVEATEEKQRVEVEKVACQGRLDLAERLVGGLSSEGTRWGNDIGRLEKEKSTLIGNVLLASAFVSYISPFDADFRNRIWRQLWLPDIVERGIPITDGIDVLTVLTDDAKLAAMMNEGLPADRMSSENGAIVTQCARWPLLIDPQLQGVRWLYGKEASGDGGSDNLMLMQLSNADWVKKMGYAVQNGKTVIVENCPVDIDSTLDPILSRALYKKGSTLYVNFAGEEIEYDKNFKLYLQTKLANPHYKPEIFAQCTLVNFIATEQGLEDQLLAKVVNVERPELEAKKQELVMMFNRFKVELKGLEDELLERLANAPEDILSDIPLIEGLEKTKQAATDIAAAVVRAKHTEVEINTAREEYRPAASESAMLYFLITDFWQIDHMYRYSLGAFTKFFFKAIDRTPEQDTTTKRVAALRSSIRFTIFTWVNRGLAEKHKLIFMSQLAFKLMARGDLGDASEQFSPSYLQFLLKAPKDDSKENPLPWLTRSAWQTVLSLVNLEGFGKFASDLEEAESRFLEWYNHVTPELEKLPLDWGQLDKKPFHKLLVIRALRPDRMTIAMRHWLREVLPDGKEYVDADASMSPVGILEAALEDSTPETPIFFILSPGADVVAIVDAVAAKRDFEKKKNFHNIALGQGQDVIAEQTLRLSHLNGHWMILNNIHLMPRWLLELEKILDAFALEGSNPKFRLFLTSEPTPYDPVRAIPIGILARSIKLTNEAPTGLKANLKRALNFLDADDFDDLDSKSKSITFGLCQFHAVTIERKKFGSKGYNMMYPFSLGDLRDSYGCLMNYMENAPSKIPWTDLRYLFGEIIYGGHIVNDGDRLLANTYLEFFMRDELLSADMNLFPFVPSDSRLAFKTIQPTLHAKYNEHVDLFLQTESPLAFGLHPNAEIGFRTIVSNKLFAQLLELQPRTVAAGGDDDVITPESVAAETMAAILTRFEDSKFDLYEVDQSLDEETKGPYQNVFIQECEGMNLLLDEIKRSLKELGQGFAGELTMSEKMESLMMSLFLDRVPEGWARLAWASMRSLGAWIIDMSQRCAQLQSWCDNPITVPRVTWLSGLKNPTSFLTAIKQVTAQDAKLELDKLSVLTTVLNEEVSGKAPTGAYLRGFYLDGARWDAEQQSIIESRPKEMYVGMPAIHATAILTEQMPAGGVYQCPTYKTLFRGPTWVFDATILTKVPAAKWILAGVALILDVGE